MSARILTPISCAALALSLALLPSPASAQSGQATTDTTTLRVEFRFARLAPAEGFQQMADPQSSRTIYVSSENVLTDADFEHARTKTNPTGLVLAVRWKPGADRRAAQILRGELGAGNDLIAVFVNGELINAPNIMVNPTSRATAPGMELSVPVSSEKVARITEAVAKRWPPPGRGSL